MRAVSFPPIFTTVRAQDRLGLLNLKTATFSLFVIIGIIIIIIAVIIIVIVTIIIKRKP